MVTKNKNRPFSNNKLLQMLQQMYEIRFFEEEAGRLYQKGIVKGGIHACIGQEAVAVGVCAALENKDYITSTHRGHGHHIAKGADPNRLMAEVLGKSTGYCGGFGGSMHVAAFEIGSLGAFPIVAAGIPTALGAALSALLLDKDYVVATFFGDGALAQGTLHESLNMASIWKLPVIFVCEDNQYAVSTKKDTVISFINLPVLASAYQIPSEEVDGQEIIAVYQATLRAVKRARSKGGPTFIHAKTYRFEGHYFGEPQVYRSRVEVQTARNEMDPIRKFQDYLINQIDINENEIQTAENNARAIINSALEYAIKSPDPVAEEYDLYVYA